ncbi:MAG: hypothetical protein Q6K92_05610 [Thermostichus sp. DG_1_5_bins_95]
MNRGQTVVLLLAPFSVLVTSAAWAQDLQFTLHHKICNSPCTIKTASTLTQFYITTSGLDSWAENLLPNPIEPGGSATVTIADREAICE